LADALFAHRQEIRDALHSDFGAHPIAASDIIEVACVANRAIAAAKHVNGWMKAEKRPIDALSFGTSTAQVAWQPKGVTGIIVPWNFPFDLSLGPLADMLAAGNRVIIKMSEFTPACGALVAEIVAKTFEPDHVTVLNGGVELGQAFSEIPWDHLLFTGNPTVGRLVATAAGANLTPVTLELGGKNPTIFAERHLRRRSRTVRPHATSARHQARQEWPDVPSRSITCSSPATCRRFRTCREGHLRWRPSRLFE